ncbi:hypothetical protein HDU96_008860 [Phlyctochytrium bullatum]|nr:hypothetical protein HDU96_008860 [Phlyctochytrium bullatum]
MSSIPNDCATLADAMPYLGARTSPGSCCYTNTTERMNLDAITNTGITCRSGRIVSIAASTNTSAAAIPSSTNSTYSANTLSGITTSVVTTRDLTTRNPIDMSSSTSSESSPPIAVIAGGVAGGLLLTIAVIVALVFLNRRRRTKPDDSPLAQPSVASRPIPVPADTGFPAPPLSTRTANPAPNEKADASGPGSLWASNGWMAAGALPATASKVVPAVPVAEISGATVFPQDRKPGSSSGRPADANRSAAAADIRGGGSAVPTRELPKTMTPERAAAQILVAAMTPAQVGERLMAMGVGPALAAALEDHQVNGARLLQLQDSDLVRMGINDEFQRELVLRSASHVVSWQEDKIRRGGSMARSDKGDFW